MKKKIGILGGMGPEATVRLMGLIVSLTKAEKDQEHLPVIVSNNPEIPCRTGAILDGGSSPLPFLIEDALMLQNAGVDLIVMPCVTAHYFYNGIIERIETEFPSLLELLLDHVRFELKGIRTVGLLATDGTVRSGLFQRQFSPHGVSIAVPSEDQQALLMNALSGPNGVKAGFKEQPKRALLGVLQNLITSDKPDAVIAGCTEIPLVLEQADIDIPFIDPLRILAEQTIIRAGGTLRNI
jgi:aspartate racemase